MFSAVTLNILEHASWYMCAKGWGVVVYIHELELLGGKVCKCSILLDNDCFCYCCLTSHLRLNGLRQRLFYSCRFSGSEFRVDLEWPVSDSGCLGLQLGKI